MLVKNPQTVGLVQSGHHYRTQHKLKQTYVKYEIKAYEKKV